MRRLLLALAAVVVVAGCAIKPETPRSDAEIAAATYRPGGQPRLELLTSINIRSGSGAHTALLINGSQQVLFDPAGSFRHPKVIRRGDIVYNTTPGLMDSYRRFQARGSYRLKVQTLPVSAELADAVLRAAQQIGRVPDARCAASVSELLKTTAGLPVDTTWFPTALADDFALIPGVTEAEFYEYVAPDGTATLGPYDRSRIALPD